MQRLSNVDLIAVNGGLSSLQNDPVMIMRDNGNGLILINNNLVDLMHNPSIYTREITRIDKHGNAVYQMRSHRNPQYRGETSTTNQTIFILGTLLSCVIGGVLLKNS